MNTTVKQTAMQSQEPISKLQDNANKRNAFQRLLLTNAYRAKAFGVISDEEYQAYEDNIHAYNELEHSELEQELDKKWRSALDAWQEEMSAKESESKARFEAKCKQINDEATYNKNRRISCPPTLQFTLWEAAKAARAVKAIRNEDMQFIRREMREATGEWLQELYRRAETARVEKETNKADLLRRIKEYNKRESCPPKNAFRL